MKYAINLSEIVKLLFFVVLLSCYLENCNGMSPPVVPVTTEARQPERAPLIEYGFVNNLKEMSALVYGELVNDEGTGLEDIERNGGIELFFRGDSREETCFAGAVMQSEDKLIVAFPGTRFVGSAPLGAGFSDLIADVNCCTSDGGSDGGFVEELGINFVHPGFAKEVMDFWSNLTQCIQRHSNYNEIFFTGHSKGGAIALLAAFKFAHDHQGLRPNFIKVFTFSAPAVFSERSRDIIHKYIDGRNIVCLYKNGDAIPAATMPAIPWLKGSFVHAGIQANITANQEKICDLSEEIQPFANFVISSIAQQRVDIVALGKCIGSVLLKKHSLDGFSISQVREVMERIKANYWLIKVEIVY